MTAPAPTVAGGASLDRPASPAATRAHAAVHIDVGTVERPLFVTHPAGKVGILVTDNDQPIGIWLAGNPDELHAFAHRLHQLANEAAAELVRAPSRDVEEPATLPKVDEERVA